jgi:hypothetical protein
VPPSRLFGELAMESSMDVVFLVSTHASDEVVVEEIDPLEVARRMAFSLAHERLGFIARYQAFRFAFPKRSSELVETASEIERDRLVEVLGAKPAYAVRYPYPVPIGQVVDVMAPYCR